MNSSRKYLGADRSALLRAVFFVMGFVFVGIGILGVILPGMPTTVFILMAGYCWSRSSKRFHVWLLRHRWFGDMLRDWEERRAIPRSAKYLAWMMMILSNLMLLWQLPSDKLWLAGVVAVFCLLGAIWIAGLPDA